MKRSENVGLMLMGGAAFAATFAGGMTYFAMQKPSHAAAQSAQACTPRSDGTQNCSAQRGFTYYFYPSHWSWGGGSSADPNRQQAALTSTSRTTPTAATGTERSGFGSTAESSFRVSAGG